MAATAVAVLAVPAASMANAGTSSGINGTGIGSTQGNAKNYTTQYKTSYVDSVNGPVSCVGVHKAGTNYSANGMDTWTCTSTNGSPLTLPGEVVAGQSYTQEWASDYFALKGNGGVIANATLTVSADGMSETGVANYS